MATVQEIRELTIRYREEGAEALAQHLKEISSSSDTAGNSLLSTSRKFDEMLRRIDPLAKAQHDFEKQTTVVASALNQGAKTTDEAARALTLLGGRYEIAKAAAEAHNRIQGQTANALKLTGQQATQLTYQLNDIAVSLAGGQNPLLVMLQQGSQITPIFGGIKGTLSAIGSGIASLITPVAGLAGALVGMTAFAAYSAYSWRASMKELDGSLEGVGRRAGVTRDELARLAASGASKGGVSTSSGYSLASTYSATGLGASETVAAIGVTKTFARVMKQDLADAGVSLAAALADPVRGYDELGKALGFADSKTRTMIATMQAQGDITGAQRALLSALSADLAKAADRTSAFGKAWLFVKQSISNASSSLGEGVDRALFGPTNEQARADLETERRRLMASIGTPVSQSAGRWGVTTGSADAADEKALALVNSRVEALDRVIDRQDRIAAGARADQEIGRKSFAADADVGRILPELQKRRDLDAEIARLEEATNNPNLMARMGSSARDLATALEAAKNAHAQMAPLAEREAAATDLALRSVRARTVEQRAQIAAERELMALKEGKIDPAANERSMRARQIIIEQSAKDADDRLRSANDNASLAGMAAYQRSVTEIQNKWRKQNEIDAGSPSALGANRSAMQAELSALAANQITGPMDAANRSLESQNRLLAISAQTFGATTDKVVAARTAQEQFNRYIEAGIPITQQMKDAVLAYAEGMGKAALAAEDLEKRQRKVVESMDDLRSTSKEIFTAIANGKAGDIGKILASKAIDFGSTQLTNALFGEKGKPGGGLFGGGLGQMFGASQSVAVANQNVTAGVVNVGGVGVGALGGLGGIASSAASSPAAAAQAAAQSAAGPLAALGKSSGYVGGVDPRLTDILTKAGAGSPWDVKLTSGLRPGDPGFHGKGMATDVQLYDKTTGAALPNYQNAGAFAQYESFAQRAKAVQMRDYPELGEDFRWGGYFGGPKGKYGALDTMHFDLGGKRAGMAGGSWEKGLTPQQLSMFPGAQSQGLGNLNGASKALEQFQNTTQTATGNLGEFGGGLGQMATSLFNGATGQGGGGGLFGGLFGALFSMFKFANGGAFSGGNVIPFANGGVMSSPTMFPMAGGRMGLMAENGEEAIMPLARGRGGKLGVRMSGPGPNLRSATEVHTSTSISIGGNTFVMQGDATAQTKDWLTSEIDRRDARLRRQLEESTLTSNRRAAVLKG